MRGAGGGRDLRADPGSGRPDTRARGRPPIDRRAPALLIALGIATLALFVLPTLVLVARALAPEALGTLLRPAAAEALRLSLVTTLTSMSIVVLLGTPLAYLLGRHDFRGRRLLDALVDLPLLLPPVIAGVGLLLVFGRRGLLGAPLSEMGVNIAFTSVAVVMAQVFVASPFFVRAVKAGFAAVPDELAGAALMDGASRLRMFVSVFLPLAAPAFVEGLVLAWARALAEFGATIVFAGSLQGRTRTLPLAVYAALESDLNAAIALSALLTVLSVTIFVVFRAVVARRVEPAG